MVVCIRHHSLVQQLCRWLLMWLARVQGSELVMTQELISNMLGARREGVTGSALKLHKAGLIRYSHGYIAVLDRSGLEQRGCEYYAVVKKESDRLLCSGPSRSNLPAPSAPAERGRSRSPPDAVARRIRMTSLSLTRIVLLTALQAACAISHAQAATSPTRGQLLYTTHCIACHNSQVHWRDQRQATDWESLTQQVRRWQATAALQWSEDDIVEVARYLNDTIYRYPRPTGVSMATRRR